jgi:hypothetical protein
MERNGKREKYILLHTEKGRKDSKWWPPCHSLVLLKSWGNSVVKDNGSGWLRWVVNREVSSRPLQITGTKGVL